MIPGARYQLVARVQKLSGRHCAHAVVRVQSVEIRLLCRPDRPRTEIAKRVLIFAFMTLFSNLNSFRIDSYRC